MTRTIGAAVGAILVLLFFITLGVGNNSRTPPTHAAIFARR